VFRDKAKTVRQLIIGTFVTVPFLSSLVSTIHLITLFLLGNTSWISIILSVTFEIGAIASLLILTILDKINKTMVFSIFLILIGMQMLGNIYYSFAYINTMLMLDPNWLSSFQEFFSYFFYGDIVLMKLMLSCLVGMPIPLISLFFLKAIVDYLKVDITDDVKVLDYKLTPVALGAVGVFLFKSKEKKEIVKVNPIELDNIHANFNKEIERKKDIVKANPIELDDIYVNFNKEFEIKEDVITNPIPIPIPKKKDDVVIVERDIENKKQKKDMVPLGQSNVAVFQNNNLI